ncbi:MAG: hypothetical protein ACK52I_24815, partial [Pseudomonadota bacterium]
MAPGPLQLLLELMHATERRLEALLVLPGFVAPEPRVARLAHGVGDLRRDRPQGHGPGRQVERRLGVGRRCERAERPNLVEQLLTPALQVELHLVRMR